VVSLAVFLFVAVKAFRVAKSKPGTAQALLRSGGTGSVVAGAVMSFLPAFLLILLSGTIWWWTAGLRARDGSSRLSDILTDVPFWVTVALLVIGWVTMPLVAYWATTAAILLLLVVLYRVSLGQRLVLLGAWVVLTGLTMPRALFDDLFHSVLTVAAVGALGALILRGVRKEERLLNLIRAAAAVAAAAFSITLMFATNMWLPAERIVIDNRVTPDQLGLVGGLDIDVAYVLEEDGGSITLLTDRDRALVHLRTTYRLAGSSDPEPVLQHYVCSRLSSEEPMGGLLERPSQTFGQLFGREHPKSPYPLCQSEQ
jgi:hypothetical protein